LLEEAKALKGYHTLKWKVEQGLDEIKIDGQTIREVRKKEL